jgi:hypothetical protein
LQDSHESECRERVKLRDLFAAAVLASGSYGDEIWHAIDAILELRGNPYEQ